MMTAGWDSWNVAALKLSEEAFHSLTWPDQWRQPEREHVIHIENLAADDDGMEKIISGEIAMPGEWELRARYGLVFLSADGERIDLRPGASWFEKCPAAEQHRLKFSVRILSGELEKIRGRKGVLRVSVSGTPFRYELLATLPPGQCQRVSAGKIKITQAPPEGEDAALFLTEIKFSGADVTLWEMNSKCELQDTAGGEIFPLTAYYRYGQDGKNGNFDGNVARLRCFNAEASRVPPERRKILIYRARNYHTEFIRADGEVILNLSGSGF